ncbi:MAG: hypothetical protein AM325_013220 [Candidatus Thorarchaeota archaeon SMTZ1-45]
MFQKERVLSNLGRVIPQILYPPPPLLLSTLEGKDHAILVNDFLVILEDGMELQHPDKLGRPFIQFWKIEVKSTGRYLME